MLKEEIIPGTYIVKLGLNVVGRFSTLEEVRAFASQRPELRYAIYQDGTLIEACGPEWGAKS